MCDEGHGLGLAGAQGGFCGLAKSLEPGYLEEDVGNWLLRLQTLQLGSEEGGENLTSEKMSENSETRKGFSRSSCGPP